MRRLIDEQLKAWKTAARRKPLIVRGARQVGKTYSVVEFGEEQFEELVVVELERNRSWHRVFEGDLSAARILSDLRVLTDRSINPGKSLLFLDEIQSCPRAVVALRYFLEEYPDLHVIAAGSLLDFALGNAAFPVGRVQFLDMHPMTFAEYLWAVGKEGAADVVLSPPGPVNEAVHAMLMDELRRYFIVGGMPEAVGESVRTGSPRAGIEVHGELVHSFRQDFAKYAPRANTYCLDAVLTNVARHVGRQIKYARLAPDYSIPTIHRAFDLLCRARVVHRVPAASPAALPLEATASAKKFKALMVDIGLARYLSGVTAEATLSSGDLLDVREGAMAEQFVGQELLASQGQPLHYWSRDARGSTAEVDYLVAARGAAVPVEVKSGARGRLRSVHMLLASRPECPEALIISSQPFASIPEQRLVFLPLYHAFSATQYGERDVGPGAGGVRR